MAVIRVEMAQMATQFHRDQRQTIRWTVGTMVAMTGLFIAALSALH